MIFNYDEYKERIKLLVTLISEMFGYEGDVNGAQENCIIRGAIFLKQEHYPNEAFRGRTDF
jgi:hypothetical protein